MRKEFVKFDILGSFGQMLNFFFVGGGGRGSWGISNGIASIGLSLKKC